MAEPQSDDFIFLQQALELAIESARGSGGPFGALVVKNGQIIGKGHNQVTEHCDPSAHAEIMAIRQACKNSHDFQLTDCTLYSSCEPCPMCLSAIYWARIPRLVYAASADQAAEAGFDDRFIYQQLSKPAGERSLIMEHQPHPLTTRSFEIWRKNPDRREY